MNQEIFTAVRKGDLNKVRMLLSQDDVNQLNDLNQSLLHEAISSRQDEIALALIGKGISLEIQDKEGKTALSYAAAHQNQAVAKAIVDVGAAIDIPDRYGNSPLWFAMQSSRADYHLFEMLLKAGADPSLKNKVNRSVIDFANQTNNDVLRGLIDNAARKN